MNLLLVFVFHPNIPQIMEKKNSYIKQRLIKNSQDKITQGRVALFGIGIVYLLITTIPLLRLVGSGVIATPVFLLTLLSPLLYIGLGFLSLKNPKIAFLIGLALVGIAFLRSLLNISLLGIIINIVIGVALYNGFQGAKTLEENIMLPIQNDDILDSELM